MSEGGSWCLPWGVGQCAWASWVQAPGRPGSQAFQREDHQWGLLVGPSRSAEPQGQGKHKLDLRHAVTYAGCLYWNSHSEFLKSVILLHVNHQTLFVVENRIKQFSTFPALQHRSSVYFAIFLSALFLVSSLYRSRSLYVSDCGQGIRDSIHGKDTGNSCFSCGAHWTSYPIHFWDAFHGGQVGRPVASIYYWIYGCTQLYHNASYTLHLYCTILRTRRMNIACFYDRLVKSYVKQYPRNRLCEGGRNFGTLVRTSWYIVHKVRIPDRYHLF